MEKLLGKNVVLKMKDGSEARGKFFDWNDYMVQLETDDVYTYWKRDIAEIREEVKEEEKAEAGDKIRKYLKKSGHQYYDAGDSLYIQSPLYEIVVDIFGKEEYSLKKDEFECFTINKETEENLKQKQREEDNYSFDPTEEAKGNERRYKSEAAVIRYIERFAVRTSR